VGLLLSRWCLPCVTKDPVNHEGLFFAFDADLSDPSCQVDDRERTHPPDGIDDERNVGQRILIGLAHLRFA